MIALQKYFLFSLAVCLSIQVATAQRGPGGVSTEVDDWVPADTTIVGFVPTDQSTNRIWLDASTLTSLADGDPVTNWPDISLSHVNDNAQVVTAEIPPYFRDDAANSINGFSVVTFEEGRFLQFISSLDINLDKITLTKTVFLAFRTGTNVSDMQILYEEGGCARGFNIYLENSQIYVGAYDLNIQGINNLGTEGTHGNGSDFDNTPQWGYTFVSTPIQANSTYILTAQFSAPTPGAIYNNTNINTNFFVRGWLNGQMFDQIDYTSGNQTNTAGANDGVNGIGTLWAHPDPIGLGAINTAFVHKNGRICSGNGTRPFQGRFAEFCYYNDLLSQTQRIIVQNYLGAKYFANIITDDKYAHEATYGVEVIGIGQQTNSADNRHVKSQGRNPFEISVTNAQLTEPDQYFLTGHNNAPKSWSQTAVPNNSVNIQRLQRVWRVDESGANMGVINFKANVNDLPTLPAGFPKMVLLIDETNANFPNFTLESTKVLEVATVDGINYSIDYDFLDNSFFTIAMLKPAVNFTLIQDFAIEGNSPPVGFAVSTEVKLNFQPFATAPAYTIDYSYIPSSAVLGSDFAYNAGVQSGGLTIPGGMQSALIPFEILNDNLPENPATESFLIILQNGINTTSGLFVGQRDTLEFFIYDNDSPPLAIFELSQSFNLENQPVALVKVLRVGNTALASTVRIRRIASPNQGTALYSTDFVMQNASGWLGGSASRYVDLLFAPGVTEMTATIDIIDDGIYESDESINLFLQPLVNFTVLPSPFHQVMIVNDELLPNARFVTSNQTGFETVGSPIIFIELDRPSALDVEVTYDVNGGMSTADLGVDFNTASPGVVQFPPMETQAWPIMIVDSDVLDEPDETAVLQLQTAVNATIAAPDVHTYTIVDYAPFENRGAAGVGRDSDNIVWLDADRINGSHGQLMQSIPNFSPRNIDMLQPDPSFQAQLQTSSNLINQRKSILFENDFYELTGHPLINQSGSFNRKSFYFVIRTGADVTATQMLYHQGLANANRGLSIYIQAGKVYFNVWNRTVVAGNPSPWYKHAVSQQTITPNLDYLISCHFDRLAPEKVVIYVNGTKNSPTGASTGAIGEFFGDNNQAILGKLVGNSRLHTNTGSGVVTTGFDFKGYISEIIFYNEPPINETRRCIVENYFSGKYNIPLDVANTDQIFDLGFANGSSTTHYFGHQIAGAGIGVDITTDLHLDGQGPGILRVKITDTDQLNSTVMWGHNNVSLNTAYPYSSAYLPNGIVERSGRVWKVFKTGTIGPMELYLNFSGIQDAPLFIGSDLKLLHHTNANPQDFANATVVAVDSIRSGPVVEFRNLNLPAGSYIALASTSTILPLPIELLNFSGRMLDTSVELIWSTATEINNDYFEIQRTGPDLKWEAIGLVPGAGTSSRTIHYMHYDRTPLPGVSYYRLKQVDFNGDFTYSDAVAILNIDVSTNDDLFIYPNPSYGGSVFIRIPAAFTKEKATVKLYSTLGQIVWTGNYAAEADLMEIKYGKLPAGVYYLTLESALIKVGSKLVISQ